MRIGLQVPSFSWPGGSQELGSRLAEIARTADDAGFASLWVMDHFFQIGYVGAADEPMLEGYGALNYLAGITKRARLGTLVTGVIYRHPGVLVKTVSTLDVLSGGRAYFGIGAAWYEREARGLGVPYPSTRERFERLEETIEIARHMWSDNTQPYNGSHYQLAEPMNHPQPLTQPHPPIMIGGGGEQRTLRLVAKYADACNIFTYEGPKFVRHKLDVLKRHCDEVGRSYEDIERTALGVAHVAPGAMTAGDVVGMCKALADVGVQHMIFSMPNVAEIAPLERFGNEIIPAVAEF